MTAENDAWSYVPHEGPHEFRPWTVLPGHKGRPWLAPGCTCGVIRSAGSPTESEEAMRLWWDTHAKEAGHVSPAAADPWCRREDCQHRHWRSGSMPTHRRGEGCPDA